jgi:hypothetical protein
MRSSGIWFSQQMTAPKRPYLLQGAGPIEGDWHRQHHRRHETGVLFFLFHHERLCTCLDERLSVRWPRAF